MTLYLALLGLHVGEVAVVVDVSGLLQVRVVPRVALRHELAFIADPALPDYYFYFFFFFI